MIANIANEHNKDIVWFLSDQEISENPVFLNNYRLRTAQLSPTLTFTYYQRQEQTTGP